MKKYKAIVLFVDYDNEKRPLTITQEADNVEMAKALIKHCLNDYYLIYDYELISIEEVK